MADTKISALTALSNADLAADDVLPIVDTTAVATKKISIADLMAGSPSNPSVQQTDIGTAPNEIPLNQYLGSLAYQNLESVVVENLTVDTGIQGDLALSTGNLVIGTAGKGIDFSGVGTAAEILDDYEEGTWTPTVFDAATGGNQGTTATAAGEYTKVGNLVTIHCTIIDIDTTGMTAGNVFYIGGLPFAAKNTASIDFHGVTDCRNITTTSGGIIASWLQDNASRARLFTTTSAGGVNGVLVSDVTSTTADIFLSLTYLAA